MTRPYDPEIHLDLTDGRAVYEAAKQAFITSVKAAVVSPHQGAHRQAAVEWAQILASLSQYSEEKIWG